jgi:hypothetical protein
MDAWTGFDYGHGSHTGFRGREEETVSSVKGDFFAEFRRRAQLQEVSVI